MTKTTEELLAGFEERMAAKEDKPLESVISEAIPSFVYGLTVYHHPNKRGWLRLEFQVRGANSIWMDIDKPNWKKFRRTVEERFDERKFLATRKPVKQ